MSFPHKTVITSNWSNVVKYKKTQWKCMSIILNYIVHNLYTFCYKHKTYLLFVLKSDEYMFNIYFQISPFIHHFRNMCHDQTYPNFKYI